MTDTDQEPGLVARLNEQIHEARVAWANLSALIESTRDWILFVDLEGRLVTFNATVADYFRIHHGTVAAPGVTLAALLPPDRAARWPSYFQKALAEGSFRSEYELADGRVLELIFNPVFKEGRPIGVSQFGKDITQRKRAEASLLERETQLRSYIDNSPVGVFLADETGQVLQASPAAQRLTGYTEAELQGFTIPELVPLDARPMVLAHFLRLLEAGYVFLETPFLRKDGSFGYWSVEAVSLSPTRFLGFTSDITGRRQAEAERVSLLDQLRQSQKMESLGVLAGGVAHDMNNVLAAILSLASAHLGVQPRETPAYSAFETIRDAAVRGGETVKRLLKFARQAPGEMRVLDLNAVLLDQVRLLEHTTLAKVQCAMTFAPDLRPMAGDGSALAHAFMNLCVNAVDAMDGAGTLSLLTRNLGPDRVEVVVADTGCGMTPFVKDRACDPFFTTKDVGKGTGLGLSMVYATVKGHQGRMEIQSEPGQGTRIQMDFPAASEPALPAPGAQSRVKVACAALKVLLVDDDELIQRGTGALVEILGHAVTPAASGEIALALLAQGFQPDLVILDMNMPGLGGRGTLPRLRALCPTVPVILATGRADEDVRALVAGDLHATLLAKPFSIEELLGHLPGV